MASDNLSKEFVISRTFDVPRAKMWKAWTEAEQLKKWWGPKGFKVIACKVDLRPGGMHHYGLQSPQGDPMWGRFVYREIEEPEKLVFVSSFADEQGNVARHFAHETWPLELLSTVTFVEKDGKTTVTVKWQALNPTEIERKTFEDGFDSMRGGWTGTFDQLGQYLARA